MNFKDHSKVREVIQKLEDADGPRSLNRADINKLFNGDPPYSDDEAEEQHIETNWNDLHASKIAHDARRQYNNAFLKPGNFFNVTLDGNDAQWPGHKRSAWAKIITKEVNRSMKDSMIYTEGLRSTHAQVVLHGIGPNWWPDQDCWCPTAVGIQDVLVPAKTLVSLENLTHFAIRVEYSYGKLWRMTQGAVVDPGWNKSLVQKILKSLKVKNAQVSEDFSNLKWEDIEERLKSNTGYYESDAVPTVKCWAFYFQDEESSKEVWNKRILLDTNIGSQFSDGNDEMKDEFLFNPGNRKYASNHKEIIHVQFGDGSNIGPFKWHTVRSLGFLLYATCHLMNRLRSKKMDATFESLLQFFRVNSVEDREKLEHIKLAHLGVLPDGVDWVKGGDRYQMNERLVESSEASLRQTLAENSSSFVQGVDNGTQQAQTATETMAKVNASAAMISGMLSMSYSYETYKYRETCRRFCRSDSRNEDVKKFQKRCLMAGVPKEMLDVERWNIEPERVMGAGNKTVEIAQADRLMQARNLYDPDAQREILHIFTETNTDDPQLAERLVPLEKPKVSDAVHDAQLASAVLMMGLPMALKQGISHIDYVETLLMTMEAVVQKIEANGGMASEEEIVGLQNLAGETIDGQPIPGNGIADHIAIIAQDPNEQQRVKQYADQLGKLMNMVKAYAQRWEEAQQQKQAAGGGLPPEAIAKIESSKILAENAVRIKEAKTHQQIVHKQQAFEADQKRKEFQGRAELTHKLASQQAENTAKDMASSAEILRKNAEAKAAPKPKAE